MFILCGGVSFCALEAAQETYPLCRKKGLEVLAHREGEEPLAEEEETAKVTAIRPLRLGYGSVLYCARDC